MKKRFLSMLVLLVAVVSGAWAQWTGGTHTATANENLNAINVSDDATLTINQGVTVTVSGGIVVADGKTLTITGGGTLVANGANGQTGTPGGTAIAGNVIINGVGLTVTATGGQGGQGGTGGEGDQGADGSNGYDGGQGGKGGKGADGGSAFSGAVTIYAGSVTATGGQGGQGGQGGNGGNGGEGDDGDGGRGGNGGDGGDGGNGGHAFAGTLTVYGGNVSAYGGQRGMYGKGGDGGVGGESLFGEFGEDGDGGKDGEDGASGYAYANSVTFEAATYTMTDGTDNITEATGKQTVIITSSDVVPAASTYSVTLADGTEDATNWTITPAEATTTGVAAGTEVKVTYSGTKKVIGVKAEKKSSAPTLKDALADGATVVINYTWGTHVTTFTYTNNGGNYTGNTTGDDAEYFNNGMSKDGTTLVFVTTNVDRSDANVGIRFYTDTNEYFISKGSSFTSFTISVNGTDLTSQLKEVK